MLEQLGWLHTSPPGFRPHPIQQFQSLGKFQVFSCQRQGGPAGTIGKSCRPDRRCGVPAFVIGIIGNGHSKAFCDLYILQQRGKNTVAARAHLGKKAGEICVQNLHDLVFGHLLATLSMSRRTIQAHEQIRQPKSNAFRQSSGKTALRRSAIFTGPI